LKWKDIPSPLQFEAGAKEVPDVLDQAVVGSGDLMGRGVIFFSEGGWGYFNPIRGVMNPLCRFVVFKVE